MNNLILHQCVSASSRSILHEESSDGVFKIFSLEIILSQYIFFLSFNLYFPS